MQHFSKPYNLILLAISMLVTFSCISGNSNNGNSSSAEIVSIDLTSEQGLQLDRLVLPDGFRITVYARVEGARSMVQASDGTIFVGSRGEGTVTAVRDTDGNFKADRVFKIAEGLRSPNGVAYKDGDLFVAEVSKIWKFRDIENTIENPQGIIINDSYPTDGHHGWKYIAFGPDGRLYVPVGVPCNICESKNELYGTITSINVDGGDRQIMATGIRNSVGFDWHPETNQLFFTDNGRDMLGDDVPPCELNRVSKLGQHFGFPFCHGGDIVDPDFGRNKNCSDFEKPVQNLGPHVAPLGLKFYTGNMFPEKYQNLIFIAEHGSWNRSSKIGYRVMMVKEKNGQGRSYKPFITGWLDESTQDSWGRPVDIILLEDGSMLISDDDSGTIYRVTYEG